MNIIALFTIPHTGTEFVKHFLVSHPDIGNEVGLNQIAKNRAVLDDPYSGQKGLVPGTTNLVWSHISEESLRAVRAFAFHVPTIITMRDPLLSLVTRKERQKDMVHLWLIEAWLVLATFIYPNAEAIYYPVDLESRKPYSKRLHGLHELSQAVGLESVNYIDQFAKDYSPVNTRGDYDLKAMYLKGDFDELKLHLKVEIRHLQNAEQILRPMLERVGYEKLMWWS